MKLWLLRPIENLKNDPWAPWYDKAVGFVVAAETAKNARQIANADGGDETGPIKNDIYRTGGDPWLNAAQSTCIELKPDNFKQVCVVLRDFMAA